MSASVRRTLLVILAVAAFLVAAFLVFAWRSTIEPVDPPPAGAFEKAALQKGETLALVGNCISCHTVDGGKPFAGGRAVATPFGTIYGTNITPDPDTGIGRWSEAAFVRSMREGVDREGRHLYPAFPYDHFTRTTDEDLRALYAYLMTREPVRADPPENQLAFPFNLRPLLAGWKLLFLDKGVYQADASQSAEWNRGAYLAQGLAHCGSCHTPRNFLGGEKRNERYGGGEAGGWHAPALNQASPAPLPWNAERLFAYLRHGIDDVHSVPAGPMVPVVRNLALAPEAEVRALAAYFASRMPSGNGDASQGGTAARVKTDGSAGRQLYVGACASCHDAGRERGGALRLGLATEVTLPTPRNLIHIIRNGIVPAEGERGPWMPAYRGALTDEQLAELVQYVRTELGRRPPWEKVLDQVRDISRGEQ